MKKYIAFGLAAVLAAAAVFAGCGEKQETAQGSPAAPEAVQEPEKTPEPTKKPEQERVTPTPAAEDKEEEEDTVIIIGEETDSESMYVIELENRTGKNIVQVAVKDALADEFTDEDDLSMNGAEFKDGRTAVLYFDPAAGEDPAEAADDAAAQENTAEPAEDAAVQENAPDAAQEDAAGGDSPLDIPEDLERYELKITADDEKEYVFTVFPAGDAESCVLLLEEDGDLGEIPYLTYISLETEETVVTLEAERGALIAQKEAEAAAEAEASAQADAAAEADAEAAARAEAEAAAQAQAEAEAAAAAQAAAEAAAAAQAQAEAEAAAAAAAQAEQEKEGCIELP